MTPNPQDSAVALEVERAIREALSEGPTSGPWTANDNEGFSSWTIWGGMTPSGNGKPGPMIAQVIGDSAEADANAQFVAACSPDNVRTLLAEIDRLRASQSDGTSGKEMEALRDQRDALMRALEVIAVGDSSDPVTDAGDELVALGYWSKEGLDAHRAAPSKSQGENHVG